MFVGIVTLPQGLIITEGGALPEGNGVDAKR